MDTDLTEIELQQVFRRILRKMVVYGKYIDSRFSGSQVAALEIILAQGPIKVTHLAENLSLSLSAVTLLCDRLIQNEYVKRERDDEDRRVVYLDITSQGKEELEAVLDKEKELVKFWFTGISEAELSQFNKTFQRVIDNVNSMNLKNKVEDLKCCHPYK